MRTYASVAAGVGEMPYRHFVFYNAIGALLWAVGVTLLGYLLGNITFIKENIEALLVLVVVLSVIPVDRRGLAQARRKKAARAPEEAATTRYDEQAERDEVERKAFGA